MRSTLTARIARSAVAGALLALVTGLTMTNAQAQVILSNLTGNPTFILADGLGTSSSTLSSRAWKAAGLTIGNQPLLFVSLEGVFSSAGPVTRVIQGGIYSNNAGVPGSELVALNPQNIAASDGQSHLTFSSATPFVLQANTTYWFNMTGSVLPNGNTTWDRRSDNVQPVASGGATFLGFQRSTNNQSSWSPSVGSNAINGIEIQATAVAPEPASLLLFTLGMGVGGFRLNTLRKQRFSG